MNSPIPNKSPVFGTYIINPITNRKIKVGGAAYNNLPNKMVVYTLKGTKKLVIHRMKSPGSPKRMSSGKKMKSPISKRKIEVGGKAYKDLYSGIIDTKHSPNKNKCKKYAYVPKELLCGLKCDTNSCYPVNSIKRYSAAYSYSKKYLGNSPKGKCIRKCADDIKKNILDSSCV